VAVDPAGTKQHVDFRHTLWNVELKYSKENYALDLTGAQYGFHEPVVPWTVYAKFRIRENIYNLWEYPYFGKEKARLIKLYDEGNGAGLLTSVNRGTSQSFKLGVLSGRKNRTLPSKRCYSCPKSVSKKGRSNWFNMSMTT
jgi:hypothetical protein